MKLQIAVALAALSIGGAAFGQEAPGGGQGPTPEMQAARQAIERNDVTHSAASGIVNRAFFMVILKLFNI